MRNTRIRLFVGLIAAFLLLSTCFAVPVFAEELGIVPMLPNSDTSMGTQLLQNEGTFISRYFMVFVPNENGDNPIHEARTTQLQIIESYTWDEPYSQVENNVIAQLEEQEEGWDLRAINHGRVVLEYSWECIDDASISGISAQEYYVIAGVFEPYCFSERNTDMMLPGEQRVFGTSLFLRSPNEDGYINREQLDAYQISVESDSAGIEISINGTEFTVTALSECFATLTVHYCIEDAEYAWTFASVQVTNDDYIDLSFDGERNVPIGAKITPLDYHPSLTRYYLQNDIICAEEIQTAKFIWRDFDEHAWRGTENALTRIGSWGTEIRLVALDDSDDVITEAWIPFSPMYYELYIVREEPFDDFQSPIMFCPTDRTFQIHAEEIIESGFDIQWEIGWFLEEGVFENADSSLYSLNENGTELTIDGTAARELLNNGVDGVQLHVSAWYQDNWLCDDYAWVCFQEEQIDYHIPDRDGRNNMLLPEWDRFISREIGVYVQNAQYPFGADFPAEISSAEFTFFQWDDETMDFAPASEDHVVAEVIEQEDGWQLRAVSMGGKVHVDYAVECAELNDSRHEEIDYYITGDIYYPSISFVKNTDCYLPGEEQELSTSLYHSWFRAENNKYGEEDVFNYTLEVDPDSYNSDCVEVSVDGHQICVTAKEFGYTNVRILFKTDQDELDEWFSVRVTDSYSDLSYTSPGQVWPGEQLSMTSLRPVLTSYYLKNGEPKSEILSEARFEFRNVDEFCWQVSENGLIRQNIQGNNLCVVALDDNGEKYCEAWIWFDGASFPQLVYADLPEDGQYGITFWVNAPADAAQHCSFWINDVQQVFPEKNGDLYPFFCPLAPAEITKQLSFGWKAGEYEEYREYSLNQLCLENFEFGDWINRYAGVWVLGCTASDYFSGELEQYVEPAQTQLESYRSVPTGTLPTGVQYMGSTVTLDSWLTIRHVFSGDISGIQLNGAPAPIQTQGELNYIEISNIGYNEMASGYTVTLGAWSLENYSVLSYAARAVTEPGMQEIASELYWFSSVASLE